MMKDVQRSTTWRGDQRSRETLLYKHGQKNAAGEKGQTFKARGQKGRSLFVPKRSLHSNEVLHNVFSKQAQPCSTLAELLEGHLMPAQALCYWEWLFLHEGLLALHRAIGRE